MSSTAQLACNAAFGLFLVAFIVAAIVAIVNIPTPAVKPVGYAIQIVDGCEYLRFFSSNTHESLTHKGNCPNH